MEGSSLCSWNLGRETLFVSFYTPGSILGSPSGRRTHEGKVTDVGRFDFDYRNTSDTVDYLCLGSTLKLFTSRWPVVPVVAYCRAHLLSPLPLRQ